MSSAVADWLQWNMPLLFPWGIVMHLGTGDKPSVMAAPPPTVPKAGRFALLGKR